MSRTVLPAPNDRWRQLLISGLWFKHSDRAFATALRCGMCRVEFTPGPGGAAVFTDKRGELLLQVCSGCEPMLHTVPNSQTAAALH